MRLPFVSREFHEAMLEERERLVVELRAEVAYLKLRLEAPVNVSVKLPDGFAVAQPAVILPRRTPKKDVKGNISAEKPAPIDWENVDPDNEAQIAAIAARELGGGPINAYALAETVGRIKKHARQARAQKRARSLEMGSVGTVIPPNTKAVTDEVVDESAVPAHIRERIERAERGELS